MSILKDFTYRHGCLYKYNADQPHNLFIVCSWVHPPVSYCVWRFVPWSKPIILCICLCVGVAVVRKLCYRKGCGSHESSGGRGSFIFRRSGNLGTVTHPCYHFHWASISRSFRSLCPILMYRLVGHCSCIWSSFDKFQRKFVAQGPYDTSSVSLEFPTGTQEVHLV